MTTLVTPGGQEDIVTTRSTAAHSPGVAVVAVGAVTSLGPTAADLWSGARSGRVAIDPVRHLDMSAFDTTVGGEVWTVPPAGPSAAHRERALEFATMAATEALTDLPNGAIAPARIGLVLATCNAGLLSAREWLRRDLVGDELDPALAALITPGGLADALAHRFGLEGPVLAVNTACASGANALGLGADLIRSGRADAVLAGGTDALSDVVFAGFNSLQSLSPEPARPYSAERRGLSLGEGSGMVLLMSPDVARSLGMPVLAEIAGYGLSADGYHATAPRPDGSGAAEAIAAALAAAGVAPADVGYVNGHGTGTPKNDPAESAAIQIGLGDAARSVAVSSTKSMIGHLLGAAGAVEAIVTIGALREQFAPPTAGFQSRDPHCPLDYVPVTGRPLSTDVAISNNFAFGGANACLVITRPNRVPPPPHPVPDEVVVTGIATMTPAGETLDALWSPGMFTPGLTSEMDGIMVGLVDVDPEPYLGRRERRRMDRLSILSVISTARALEAAGLLPCSPEVASCGVLFGTGVGPMEAMERFVRPMLSDPFAPGDPGVFPNTVYNQAPGQVALHLGLRGPTSTVSIGHASGAATIGYAADLLRQGRATMLVATVADVPTAQVVRAFRVAGLVSPSVGAARGGPAMSEACVSLVLERRSAALARGVPILGRVSGWGLSFGRPSPWSGTATDGSRHRAMAAALAESGLAPEDLNDVWLTDGVQSTARPAVGGTAGSAFPFEARVPRCHRIADTLGDTIGVGGALGVAAAVLAWRRLGPGPALVSSSSLGGNTISVALTPDEAPVKGRLL